MVLAKHVGSLKKKMTLSVLKNLTIKADELVGNIDQYLHLVIFCYLIAKRKCISKFIIKIKNRIELKYLLNL